MSLLPSLVADPDVRSLAGSFLLLAVSGAVSDKAAKIAFSGVANSEAPPLRDAVHTLFSFFCDQAGQGCPPGSPRLLSYLADGGPDKALLVTLSLFLLSLRTLKIRSALRLCVLLNNSYFHLMLVRALLVTLTTLPSPSPLCRGVTLLSDLPSAGWFLAPIYCNDLLFSGHATLTTLATLFVHASLSSGTASDPSRRLRRLQSLPGAGAVAGAAKRACLFVWCAAALLWSIVLRDHYSCDVAVGALLAGLYFKAYFEEDVFKEYCKGQRKVAHATITSLPRRRKNE